MTLKNIEKFCQSRKSKLLYILFFGTIIFLMSACSPSRKQILFQDIPKDTTLTNLISKNFEPKIQNGDVLIISVASLSPENTLIYNVAPNMVGGKLGYLVDAKGTIEFVKLGRISAAGLTQKELKNQLEKNLQPYLSQNIVSVGFLNRHVTLIGAASPKIIPLEDDNMTILDVLAASGTSDNIITNNILVIREKGNDRDFKRINLTNKSIFYSPYFYLRPNDIIYIEANPKNTNNTVQIISYVTTGITFAIFLLDRILK